VTRATRPRVRQMKILMKSFTVDREWFLLLCSKIVEKSAGSCEFRPEGGSEEISYIPKISLSFTNGLTSR
jgi:hypothetical protein